MCVCVCVLCFAVLFCSAILIFLIDKTYAPHVLQLQPQFLLRLIKLIEVQFGLRLSPLLKEHIIIVTVIVISSCAASRLIEKHNKTRFTTHPTSHTVLSPLPPPTSHTARTVRSTALICTTGKLALGTLVSPDRARAPTVLATTTTTTTTLKGRVKLCDFPTCFAVC